MREIKKIKTPKSYWNYRVIKMPDAKLKGLPKSYSYGIYDVYYTKGIPHSWGAEPTYPTGETWNDLLKDWNRLFDAFTKTVLTIRNNKIIDTGNLFK